jgi:hypothetical protein
MARYACLDRLRVRLRYACEKDLCGCDSNFMHDHVYILVLASLFSLSTLSMPKEIVTRRLVVYGAGSPYGHPNVPDVRIGII